MRDIADVRKQKLEKVLRKLNRGLDENDPVFRGMMDEASKESVIG